MITKHMILLVLGSGLCCVGMNGVAANDANSLALSFYNASTISIPLSVTCQTIMGTHTTTILIPQQNTNTFDNVFYKDGHTTTAGYCWAYFTLPPSPPSSVTKVSATSSDYGTIMVKNIASNLQNLCLQLPGSDSFTQVTSGNTATYTITGNPDMKTDKTSAVFSLYFTTDNCGTTKDAKFNIAKPDVGATSR